MCDLCVYNATLLLNAYKEKIKVEWLSKEPYYHSNDEMCVSSVTDLVSRPNSPFVNSICTF